MTLFGETVAWCGWQESSVGNPRLRQLVVVERGIRGSGKRLGFVVRQMCSLIRWSYIRRGEWREVISPASPGRSLAATNDQEFKESLQYQGCCLTGQSSGTPSGRAEIGTLSPA